jgi:hypothetical protein
MPAGDTTVGSRPFPRTATGPSTGAPDRRLHRLPRCSLATRTGLNALLLFAFAPQVIAQSVCMLDK